MPISILQNINQRKNKILIIAPIPPPIQGISIATKQILDSHILDNHKVILINSSTGLLGVVRHHRITKIIRYIFVYIKQIYFCIIYKPDYLYLTLSQSHLGLLRDSIILFIGSIFKCKIIIHLHGSLFRELFNSLNLLERNIITKGISRVYKCIVLSENFTNSFEGLVDKDKVLTINNGLADTVYRSDLRAKNSHSIGNSIKILFLNNLIPQKGLEDLILALGILNKKQINFSLLIVGKFHEDEYHKKINMLINDTLLSDKVKFYGQIVGKDKEQIYEEADIFVFPSRFVEGQPLVLLEAMRAGLPIITSTTGNSAKLITNYQNGLEFTTFDYSDLSKKIEELALDKKKRYEIGVSARQTYETYYTETLYLTKIEKIFLD